MKPKPLTSLFLSLIALAIGFVLINNGRRESKPAPVFRNSNSQANTNEEFSNNDYIFFGSISKYFFIPL